VTPMTRCIPQNNRKHLFLNIIPFHFAEELPTPYMQRITEQPSEHDNLEKLSAEEILLGINDEDKKVAQAVEEAIPTISAFLSELELRFRDGGRLFYIGAGTSGRLVILDASEIPPTYGLPHDRVIGLIAGGDGAIRKAVEYAEDSNSLAEKELKKFNLNEKDTVVGLAASGTTPYVIGGLIYARSIQALTCSITCNPQSPLAKEAHFPIEVLVGPEYVTGSTRMKSGTAQKMVLNMISTALMIRVGRVQGNKMVHMQLNNQKLIERGVRFIVEELDVSEVEASTLLEKYGSVNAAIGSYSKS